MTVPQKSECIMWIPNETRNDGSGIQIILKLRDSGYRSRPALNAIDIPAHKPRLNDTSKEFRTLHDTLM
jgi:hypothetical protein